VRQQKLAHESDPLGALQVPALDLYSVRLIAVKDEEVDAAVASTADVDHFAIEEVSEYLPDEILGGPSPIGASAYASWARVSTVPPGTAARSSSAATADGARPMTVPPLSVHARANTCIAVVLPEPAGAIASWTR
jgi:hypothetical protein